MSVDVKGPIGFRGPLHTGPDLCTSVAELGVGSRSRALPESQPPPRSISFLPTICRARSGSRRCLSNKLFISSPLLAWRLGPSAISSLLQFGRPSAPHDAFCHGFVCNLYFCEMICHVRHRPSLYSAPTSLPLLMRSPFCNLMTYTPSPQTSGSPDLPCHLGETTRTHLMP